MGYTTLEGMIEMMKAEGVLGPKKWGIRAKGSRPFFLVDGLGSPRLFETGKDAARWAESKLTSFLTTEFDVVNLANAEVYRAKADEPEVKASEPTTSPTPPRPWTIGEPVILDAGPHYTGPTMYVAEVEPEGLWLAWDHVNPGRVWVTDDSVTRPVAHQWKAGDRARIKEGVHWGSRTWGNFQLNCGDEIVVSGHSGLPSSVSFLRPYDNFPVSIKIEYIEYVPERAMIEEPDHDADEPEPIAPDDTDYILDLIRSTIDDGYQANADGDTLAVARAFGRIEGMLDGIDLAILDDEGDE